MAMRFIVDLIAFVAIVATLAVAAVLLAIGRAAAGFWRRITGG